MEELYDCVIEDTEPIHRLLVVSRQEETLDLIAGRLRVIWIGHKVGKAVAILLEEFDECKNVRAHPFGEICDIGIRSFS